MSSSPLPNPLCSHKSAKLKSSYRREYLAVDGDVDLQMTGPVIKASAVLMYVLCGKCALIGVLCVA